MSRFSEILQELSDGYSLNELKIFHNEEIIKDFTAMLKSKDLTVDEAVALKRYCEDSKIILKCSRNLSLDEEYTQIVNNSIQHLQDNNFSKEDIEMCLNYILNLDYSLPLYKNYELTKTDFLETFTNTKLRSINTIIQNFIILVT